MENFPKDCIFLNGFWGRDVKGGLAAGFHCTVVVEVMKWMEYQRRAKPMPRFRQRNVELV